MLDETEVDSIPGARITPSAGVAEQLSSEEMVRLYCRGRKMAEWLVKGSVGDAVV